MTTTEGLSRRINEQGAALKEMREELAKADARIEELEALIKSLENGWRCHNEGQLSKIEDLCAELACYRDALGFLRNRTSLDHEQREIVDCALDQ